MIFFSLLNHFHVCCFVCFFLYLSGASPVVAFVVEYFSHELGLGWVVASDSVPQSTYVVRNLQPDTNYMFLVRSKNTHGLSVPSPVTETVQTKG